jgi:hypothetical protein
MRGRRPARDLLEQSFAQFQADRSVVGLARRIEHNTKALAGYAKSMRCHLGDFVMRPPSASGADVSIGARPGGYGSRFGA